ncbi:hypothetical protein FHX08_001209 [Rhizobium sp. BK529]|uniref:hypothetical protein n=1 Tax=unclassified Rhizobium TaxID=2613769 RepID=UPI0010507DE8|nr:MULTISPECIES: hypothetical protein [unclassified Rhizobium]MBB3590865.1 hypothetical protein [Rhizobium sp. BK529]TCS09180.1 hypothetical protein EV281_1011061 [Rhizobium sp. BK418]
MISNHSGGGDYALFRTPTRGHGACRPDAIGMVQPLAAFLLAAGFVLSLAGRYEGQLIRAERIHQEVADR